jgi:hypothetical protein
MLSIILAGFALNFARKKHHQSFFNRAIRFFPHFTVPISHIFVRQLFYLKHTKKLFFNPYKKNIRIFLIMKQETNRKMFLELAALYKDNNYSNVLTLFCI